jgi:hypothetical protein
MNPRPRDSKKAAQSLRTLAPLRDRSLLQVWQPPLPGIVDVALDTSPGGGLAPDELRNLQVEPIAIDRVAIVRAALAKVTPEEALQTIVEWLEPHGWGVVRLAR